MSTFKDLNQFSPHILGGAIAKVKRGRRRLEHIPIQQALPWYSLYVIENGEVQITTDIHGQVKILAPCTLLIQPGTSFKLEVPVASDFAWFEWGIRASQLEERHQGQSELGWRYADRKNQPQDMEAFGVELPLELPTDLYHSTWELSHRVNGLWWRDGAHYLRANNLLGTWLLDVLDTFRLKENTINLSGEPSGNLKKYIEIAESQLEQTLTVQSWARLLHMTPKTLNKRFQEAAGITAKEMLDQLRFQRARSWLLQGKNTWDVAKYAGFGSRSSFSRWFQHRTGVPPGKWRNQQGK